MNKPTTTQEQLDKFKQFLAEECFDLKKYKDGKYDKKIFDYFQKDRTTVIETTRKETASKILSELNYQVIRPGNICSYSMSIEAHDRLKDKYLTESESHGK